MKRVAIKDRMKHMDAEGHDNTTPTQVVANKLSATDYEQIALNRVDALELEEETGEAVEILSDLKDTAECIQNTIDETLENLDDMTPVEIGAAIGKVEAHIDDLGESTDELKEGVDSEAMSHDPKAVTRALLTSYRGKAAVALSGVKREDGSVDQEGFFDVFKSAKTKLNESATKAKGWVEDNNSRISDLTATMAEKSDELKDPEAKASIVGKIGNRLATVRASDSKLDDLVKYAGNITNIPESTSGLTAIDSNVLKLIKGFDKSIKAEDFVKAVRVDGKTLSYVVLSKADGLVGFREYTSNTIPGASIASAVKKYTDSDFTLGYVKQLLATAKSINDKITSTTAVLINEVNTIDGMLSDDINKAKWEKGPMFKMGGWNWFFVVMGGVFGIAGSLAEASRDGKKTFEELEAKDKEKILRTRAELTARFGNDAIFGINNLVNELLETASIILKDLKDKEEK